MVCQRTSAADCDRLRHFGAGDDCVRRAWPGKVPAWTGVHGLRNINPSMVAVDDTVERLLADGVELYRKHQLEAATACWERVLEINPNELRARDLLQHARATALPFDELRSQLQALLQAHQFEAMLALLTSAVDQYPADQSVAKLLWLTKHRITYDYVARIGSLAHIPLTLAPDRLDGLSANAVLLANLINGSLTVQELLTMSPLGKLATLCALHELVVNVDLQFLAPLPPVNDGDSLAQREFIETVLNEPHSAVNSSRQTQQGYVFVPVRPPAAAIRELAPVAKISQTPVHAEAEVPRTHNVDEMLNEAADAFLLGNVHRATALYEQCLALRPDDTRARHNLDVLLKRKVRTGG